MSSPLSSQAPEELPPFGRLVTMDDMVLFEPEGHRNIHTDDEVARVAGLPAAIAAGVQFMSYIFEMLYQRFGFDSVPGTVLDVRIRAPVFAGDTVTARGRLRGTSAEHGETRMELEVWCENQRRERVVEGTAKVPLSRGG